MSPFCGQYYEKGVAFYLGTLALCPETPSFKLDSQLTILTAVVLEKKKGGAGEETIFFKSTRYNEVHLSSEIGPDFQSC